VATKPTSLSVLTVNGERVTVSASALDAVGAVDAVDAMGATGASWATAIGAMVKTKARKAVRLMMRGRGEFIGKRRDAGI